MTKKKSLVDMQPKSIQAEQPETIPSVGQEETIDENTDPDPKENTDVDKIPTKEQERLSPVVRQAAKNVFSTHLNDELFFTADNSCFTERYQAAAHAVSLENKDITNVKREEI